MCTVFEEIAIEGEAKGIIEAGIEAGVSESNILCMIQKKLNVSLEMAQDYLVRYKRAEIFDAMEEARRVSKDQNSKRYGDLSGYWSRRIDEKNRLVYKIADETIRIAQCRTHYGDK